MQVFIRACATRVARTTLVGALALSLTLPAWAASDDPVTAPLVDPSLAALLHEELSGELAKEAVIALSRHHRIPGSRGYHDAAHWVLEQLRAMGFDEQHAWIESFPSDGERRYQTWQSPSGWDIERDELLNGDVEGTGLEPNSMDVVVARIPGSEQPDDQLVFSAHLDHPKESTNDNASGAAAILDIARALRSLIDERRMPAPGRTLTFLWVPELFGTMAYIDAHPELRGPVLGGRVLANMNLDLDMVGEKTDLRNCRLELTRTPGSLPSVVDDVVENVAAMVDGMDVCTPHGSQSAFNYRVTPCSPGSDHMMFIDRKIPATMFRHTPDFRHHTSEDTPVEVDPVQLERCELIAACSMLYLANLTTGQGIELCQVATASASESMGHQARRAYKLVIEARDGQVMAAWSRAQEILDQASREAYDSLRSVMCFRDDEGVLAVLRQCASNLSDQWTSHSNGLKTLAAMRGQAGNRPPPVDEVPDERVPTRLTHGPLAFDLPESRLPPGRAAWYTSEGADVDLLLRFEAVNFVDGKRTVSQIASNLRGSLADIPTSHVARYLEDLVTVGALAWRSGTKDR